jgi:chromosome partitioning protein
MGDEEASQRGREMICIALYNAKGGVGKTAACVNLSFLASSEGKKTLLWDLDSQASSSFYLRAEQKKKGGIKKLARGRKTKINAYIQKTQFENLTLIPADFSARKLDIIFHDTKKPKKQLENLLGRLETHYEIVFLDAPPSFSLLSENILRAVDFLLLPMIPTTLSVRTFLQIMKYMEDRGLDLKKVFPFFSLVDMRKKVHRETVHSYTDIENNFLKTYIPYSSDVEKMGVRCMPLFTFANQSRAAQAYRSLWEEIKEKTMR